MQLNNVGARLAACCNRWGSPQRRCTMRQLMIISGLAPHQVNKERKKMIVLYKSGLASLHVYIYINVCIYIYIYLLRKGAAHNSEAIFAQDHSYAFFGQQLLIIQTHLLPSNLCSQQATSIQRCLWQKNTFHLLRKVAASFIGQPSATRTTRGVAVSLVEHSENMTVGLL